MNNPSRQRSYVLTPSRQAMGKTLGRRAHQSFAKHALKNEAVRRFIISGLKKYVKVEMKQLCSDSFLLDKGKEKLCNFTWNALDAVIKGKAPILHSLLKSCISSHSALNDQIIIGVCASILAKACRPAASLIQHIVSTILYAGHSGKQVCSMYAMHCSCVCVGGGGGGRCACVHICECVCVHVCV